MELKALFKAPLRTKGRDIIDADGIRFKLASVNWYGGSDELFVPTGLEVKHRSDIALQIRQMGFNSVRLPYSDEMVRSNPVIQSDVLTANPDLVGFRALDVYAACVNALTDAGLAVIINDHITHARWCDGMSLCDAAWYNDHLSLFCSVRQTEEMWIENWETVMSHFIDNPRVIGADLRNEVRGIWGTMTWDSWATAAEKASERLLAMQPNWLMIVEGISSANDLTGVRTRPVQLSIPNRVVYSAHVFAWSGWGSRDPFSGRTYPSFVLAMEKNWGFIRQEEIAPVWVAEMGNSDKPSEGDLNYWNNLMQYLEENNVDFGYWAINPRKPHLYQPESWGLVKDDWDTVIEDYRMKDMRRLMAQCL